MLDHAFILIVEDEPFIALELKASVEDGGGNVVGPVGSVREAIELLKTVVVRAAILDVQLTDGDVTPVAVALLEQGIPVIFHSGVELPPELLRCFPNPNVCRKPVSTDLLVERLQELIDG